MYGIKIFIRQNLPTESSETVDNASMKTTSGTFFNDYCASYVFLVYVFWTKSMFSVQGLNFLSKKQKKKIAYPWLNILNDEKQPDLAV